LFDSLGVCGRYLLGRCFHNLLNANRASKTVKGPGDQYILPQEAGGSLLVIYVIPDVVVIVLQHKPHIVLGDNFPTERLPLGLRALGL
jgi:hypothetical protein